MTAPLVEPFGLPAGHYRAILADPATEFQTWSDRGKDRSASKHYRTMSWQELADLPVREIAAPNCVNDCSNDDGHRIVGLHIQDLRVLLDEGGRDASRDVSG